MHHVGSFVWSIQAHTPLLIHRIRAPLGGQFCSHIYAKSKIENEHFPLRNEGKHWQHLVTSATSAPYGYFFPTLHNRVGLQVKEEGEAGTTS